MFLWGLALLLRDLEDNKAWSSTQGGEEGALAIPQNDNTTKETAASGGPSRSQTLEPQGHARCVCVQWSQMNVTEDRKKCNVGLNLLFKGQSHLQLHYVWAI